MSAYCTSCGQPIPEGQGSSCSMCYGDPNHGRDGYYAKWLQDQEEEARRTAEAEHGREMRAANE